MVPSLAACGNSTKQQASASVAGAGQVTSAKASSTSGETALSLWTENAPAREKLISCAEVVTQEGGADYIPPEDRIAVFDLDGTLFCETDPKYVDYCLLEYRVL